jgi:hypothetical protein
MPDYYPAHLTVQSQRLFETLHDWAKPRTDVGIIGGWAVVQLVDPGVAIPSRDVDLLFRSPQALQDFMQHAEEWKLRRGQDPKDQRLLFNYEPAGGDVVVDVFIARTGARWSLPLGTRVPEIAHAFEGVLPSLSWLIQEKLRVIPMRMGKEALDKQEKDLIDLHRLVFHNREATTPLALLEGTSRAARREAQSRIERAIRRHPDFAQDLRTLDRWLSRP